MIEIYKTIYFSYCSLDDNDDLWDDRKYLEFNSVELIKTTPSSTGS